MTAVRALTGLPAIGLLGAGLLLAGCTDGRSAVPTGSPTATATSSPAPTPVAGPCRPLTGEATTLAVAISDALADTLPDVPKGVTSGWQLVDRSRGIQCQEHGKRPMLAASTLKVAMVTTLGMQRAAKGGGLTAADKALATAAIRYSDNDAADRLWALIGEGKGLQRAARTLGLTGVKPEFSPWWGRTEVSPLSQVQLLQSLRNADGDSPIPEATRAFVLRNMAQVVDGQRWGISAGLPPDATFINKNGWIEWHGSWKVNSIGIVTVPSGAYELAVFSDGDQTYGEGLDYVEGVAKAVNRALAAATPTA